MTNIIAIEYIINLFILLIFHMHMFQLNSYHYNKHFYWIKVNYKKIIIQIVLVIIPLILNYINNPISNLIAIFILGISIIYNCPKNKSKISFKLTNRVKRMLITEIILFTIILILGNIQNYILIKLCILNILTICISIIANIINSPI